ncbi:MAG: UvrD-helicase domain-containing protein [Terriglobia bacterium]
MTALQDARRVLRSETRVVVVEAPAGCGKTYEAVTLARDLLATLKPRQQVLLLAHTNAATAEFRARLRNLTSTSIVVTTFDSFALELLRAYALALGLPARFRVGPAGSVPFADLAPKLNALLSRAPTIARHLAVHYPVLIADEHQDASRDQHALVKVLLDAGVARVRLFGDPMQSIYDFDGHLVAWHDVLALGDAVIQLDEPWRWRSTPEFAAWITAGRRDLANGQRLRVLSGAQHVDTVRIAAQDDAPHFMSGRPVQGLKGPLMRILKRVDSSVLILTRHNRHVLGMRKLLGTFAPVYEGADVEPAYEFLDAVEKCGRNPRRIGARVMRLLRSVSAGITAAVARQIKESLTADGVQVGRKKRIATVGAALSVLYDDPSPWGACEALRRIAANPPSWLKMHLPECLRVLARVRRADEQTPAEVLDGVVQARKRSGWMPRRSITTIHKAKGREADHVIVVHCAESVFPDDEQGRRLLYVATSRARRSVTLIVPGSRPTPLLRFD